MTVKAQLEGHQFDLATLLELFPDGDPAIVEDGDDYYLSARAFDGLSHEGGRLQEVAISILTQLNGIARLRDGSFRPVRLSNRYVHDAGSVHTVVAVVTAEARLRATATLMINGVVATTESPGPRYMSLASNNSDVAELLALIGGELSELTWGDLYKAFEIIRDAVGGGRKGLITAGWITDDDLGAFTGSANLPAASGIGARHARLPGNPKQTMTLEEGRQVIRDLATKWLDSLS